MQHGTDNKLYCMYKHMYVAANMWVLHSAFINTITHTYDNTSHGA